MSLGQENAWYDLLCKLLHYNFLVLFFKFDIAKLVIFILFYLTFIYNATLVDRLCL
jgi:hypothetical protein